MDLIRAVRSFLCMIKKLFFLCNEILEWLLQVNKYWGGESHLILFSNPFCLDTHIETYLDNIVDRLFANDPGDQGSIFRLSHTKHLKNGTWYLLA